jgi:hypothetical protein
MTEASWLADPTGRHELRYWDGSTWTDHVSDQGVTGLDPVGAPPVAPGTPPAPEPTAPMPTEPMPTVGPPTTAGPPPYTPAGGPPPYAPTGGVDGPSFTVPPAELAAAGAAGKGSGAPVGLIVGVAALAALLAVGAWFLFVRDDGDESADDVVVQQSSTTTSTSTPGDESTTTTDAPATTTTTTTEATTSTTEGPDVPTTPDGDGAGTFSLAFGSGEAYRHTITLDTDEAVRVRAVDDRGADLVLSFTAPEAQAIAWYRAAAAAAPDFFYLDDDATDEDVLLNFYLSSPGLELLDDEVVIDYRDSEFEAPEANWLVASTPGTYTIVLNEWSGGAAGGVTLVIETLTGVDFARAVAEGDDPFLNGPFFDATATPPSGPTGPTAPSGPPGG